jgi:transglutaminase-like putative cysteine protease
MLIRIGYEIAFQVSQTTPMILMLNVRPERTTDLLSPDFILSDPVLNIFQYIDIFGNRCSRVTVPPGHVVFRTETLIQDSGVSDRYVPQARIIPIDQLPPETLIYLLGSRYCEVDKLSEFAWGRFGYLPNDWLKVAAVVQYVHIHITFGYGHARATRTAFEAWQEGVGVCRDFAHLALTLCRCLNIPARYCTGYLGDIGVPRDPAPMDFSGWFEAYLDGHWYTFDARHNHPRTGRILMGIGRDAADVAISTIFGPNTLQSFKVITDEEAPQA